MAGQTIFGPGGMPERINYRGGVGGGGRNWDPNTQRRGGWARKPGGAVTPGWGGGTTQGGGGFAGQGGGGGGGNANANWNIAQNPMLDAVFKRFDELWGKSEELGKKGFNAEPAIQDYERMRAQGMKQAQAQAGQRGLNAGLGSLAATQNFMQGTEQGAQKIAADQYNTGLNFQKDLLGQMASALSGQGNVANNSAQAQLGLMNAGINAQQVNQDYQLKMAQLPLQMQQAQLSALSQLLSLL